MLDNINIINTNNSEINTFEHNFPTNKFLLGISYGQKQFLLSLSTNFNIKDQYDFSAKLTSLLENKALY